MKEINVSLIHQKFYHDDYKNKSYREWRQIHEEFWAFSQGRKWSDDAEAEPHHVPTNSGETLPSEEDGELSERQRLIEMEKSVIKT